jgi:hypothetical protein
METTINTEFKNLISKKLDLDLFWSISIDRNSVRIIGDYSESLVKYLYEKSFEEEDYLYSDDEDRLEFENGSIKVLLIKE